MPGIILSDEAKEIMEYIQEFGCITDKQLDLLLGKKVSNKTYYIGTLRVKYIREDNGRYYMKTKKPEPNPIVETCGWVLLNNYKNSDGTTVSAFRDNDPVVLTFMKDEKVYHVVYVDRNRKASISYLERYYFDAINPEGKKDVPDSYVFVIDKLDYLDIFKELEVHLPHTVVFVNKESAPANNGIPKLEYYA